MNRRLSLLLLGAVFLLMVPAASPKNQKAIIPAFFKNAQYVYVEAYDGDIYNPRLIQEDREAIYNVEQGLRNWKRYVLVTQRDQAELLFLVRKGRLVDATARADVDRGSRNRTPYPPDPTRSDDFPPGVGVGVGAEAGNPDDTLAVHLIDPSGAIGTSIWMHTLKGGLDAPEIPLFQRVKQEVDTAYP